MKPRLALPLPVPFACALFVVGVAFVAIRPELSPSVWIPVGSGLTIGAVAGILGALLARRRAMVGPFLVALAVGAGLWRAAAAVGGQAQPWDAAPTGPLRVAAVVQAVDERGQTARLTVRVDQVLSPERLSPPRGLMQLTTRALPPVEPGDRIEFIGRVEPVRPTMADGRRLLARGVVATSAYPRIVPTVSSPQGAIASTLQAWRTSIKTAIDRAVPEPQAALLNGLLIGSSRGMPESFQQALVASGTTHIVVVSGFNITLVAGAFMTIARPWGRVGAVLPLVGLWFFALLAGATAPTLRAAVMATIALFALRSGRGADALAALTLTCAGMLAVDPSLVADLSFQLSAVATLGLIALQPRISALVPWLPEPAREPLAATLAAELATLPIIAAVFHQVSVVGPVTNVLVAPLIPVATIAGAIGALANLAVPVAAPIVGALLMVPTVPMVAIIEASARVPGATAPVGDVSPLLAAIYALLLLAWAIAPTPEGRAFLAAARSSPLLRPAAIALVCLSIFGTIAWARSGESKNPLVVSVIDVGQGDAVFVRTPLGKTLLIDGGPNPSTLLAGIGRRMRLAERNLSIVALTRADSEHLPGMVAALDRYPSTLYVGPAEESPSSLYQRWRSAASTGRLVSADAPTTIAVEPDVTLEVLPTAPIVGPSGTDAAPRRSLALRLQHGSVSMLIASTSTPADVVRSAGSGMSVAADALIVPRHGSANSVDAAMLAAVHPSVAVISVGARNREGSPTRETLALLDSISVYRTDTHGTVELSTDGTALWVSPERAP